MQRILLFGRRVFRLFDAGSPHTATSAPTPDSLSGAATIIDGDTIIVAGERIRLHGLDAPELDQNFLWRGKQAACGMMALAALEALTAGVNVRCEVTGRDPYGRLIAKCFSPNGIDIGRRLVSSGWALAYRRYSKDYIDAESEARKAKRGIWRGRFEKPWVWRAVVRRADNQGWTRPFIRKF